MPSGLAEAAVAYQAPFDTGHEPLLQGVATPSAERAVNEAEANPELTGLPLGAANLLHRGTVFLL